MGIIKNSFLVNKFADAIWMMKPDRLRTLSTFLLSRINNPEELSKSLNSLQLSEKKDSNIEVQVVGKTAILNIEGMLVPKCSWLDSMCGMTSTLELCMKFNELSEDSRIDKIINYFDSPGGEVTAIMEFAEAVYNSKKEVVTFTDTEMCSAAYYIGAASSKIVCLPSANIGSLGVYATLAKVEQPINKAENAGSVSNKVTVTFIQAGSNKLFGNPLVEITPEEKEYFQSRVNSNYERMVSNIAKYRGVSIDEVKQTEGSHYEAVDSPKWMYDTLANYQELFN